MTTITAPERPHDPELAQAARVMMAALVDHHQDCVREALAGDPAGLLAALEDAAHPGTAP